MRPALPLLPLPLPLPLPLEGLCGLPAKSSSPRRPPTPPRRTHSVTWVSVVAARTASAVNAEMVGVALLAAEARRRGGIMVRERLFVGRKGDGASPLLRSRVRLLEKDVDAIVRTMVKAKAKVRARLRMRPVAPLIAKN